VTLSIGANDVDACATAAGINAACVQQGLAALAANLPAITGALRAAGPAPGAVFAGLNLYDPFLAAWLQGTAGQQLAEQSVTLLGSLNGIVAGAYSAAGFRLADVAAAFRVTQFSPLVRLAGVGRVPLNVARTCQLTWMCAAAPRGPNIHPDRAGYAVIAAAFARVLR
jgi:lysophospholipase L1-like esterase